MNQSQFQQAAGISAGLSARWFPHIDAAMKEFGITATNDLAMFIAQVGHESAGFTSLVEMYTDIKVVSFNMKKTLKLSTSSDRPT